MEDALSLLSPTALSRRKEQRRIREQERIRRREEEQRQREQRAAPIQSAFDLAAAPAAHAAAAATAAATAAPPSHQEAGARAPAAAAKALPLHQPRLARPLATLNGSFNGAMKSRSAPQPQPQRAPLPSSVLQQHQGLARVRDPSAARPAEGLQRDRYASAPVPRSAVACGEKGGMGGDSSAAPAAELTFTRRPPSPGFGGKGRRRRHRAVGRRAASPVQPLHGAVSVPPASAATALPAAAHREDDVEMDEDSASGSRGGSAGEPAGTRPAASPRGARAPSAAADDVMDEDEDDVEAEDQEQGLTAVQNKAEDRWPEGAHSSPQMTFSSSQAQDWPSLWPSKRTCVWERGGEAHSRTWATWVGKRSSLMRSAGALTIIRARSAVSAVQGRHFLSSTRGGKERRRHPPPSLTWSDTAPTASFWRRKARCVGPGVSGLIARVALLPWPALLTPPLSAAHRATLQLSQWTAPAAATEPPVLTMATPLTGKVIGLFAPDAAHVGLVQEEPAGTDGSAQGVSFALR